LFLRPSLRRGILDRVRRLGRPSFSDVAMAPDFRADPPDIIEPDVRFDAVARGPAMASRRTIGVWPERRPPPGHPCARRQEPGRRRRGSGAHRSTPPVNPSGRRTVRL